MLQTVPVRMSSGFVRRTAFPPSKASKRGSSMLGFGHAKDAFVLFAGCRRRQTLSRMCASAALSAHAIDVETIIRVLMSGLAEPASQLLPSGLFWIFRSQ